MFKSLISSKIPSFAKGVSLIELMLSIVISTMILSSLTLIYLTTQKHLQAQEALMTIQENSYAATQILTRAIRTAGYIGCAKLTNDFPLISDIAFNENNKIKPYYHEQVKPGSDAITIMRANPMNADVVKDMSDYSRLVISGEPQWDKKNSLLISDCESAEIFRIANVENSDTNFQIITASKPLDKLYQQHSEVSQFEINSYFIAKTERFDKSGLPIYALFLKDIGSHKMELVEGVNEMIIHYGVLENGRLVEKKANQIYDRSNIAGVSIMLELAGLNGSRMKKNEYTYIALRE